MEECTKSRKNSARKGIGGNFQALWPACDNPLPAGFHAGDIDTILLLTCALQAYQLCCSLGAAVTARGITVLQKTIGEQSR